MRRKNPATKSAKKSGGPKKQKSAKKSVLPKTDPKISDGKNLVKFWGRTFLAARKARKNSGRISGQISEKTSFQVSRLFFSETSFSRRAVLTLRGLDRKHFPVSTLWGASERVFQGCFFFFFLFGKVIFRGCVFLPGSELTVIWKGWFETALCRATPNTPFSTLCPRILGTRFTNYGLRVSGLLTVEVFLLTVRLFYLRWGEP